MSIFKRIAGAMLLLSLFVCGKAFGQADGAGGHDYSHFKKLRIANEYMHLFILDIFCQNKSIKPRDLYYCILAA